MEDQNANGPGPQRKGCNQAPIHNKNSLVRKSTSAMFKLKKKGQCRVKRLRGDSCSAPMFPLKMMGYEAETRKAYASFQMIQTSSEAPCLIQNINVSSD